MKSKYRDWILPILVLAILLAFTPHALYRVIKTGNPYLFTSDFFGDILARLHGPGRFRFILQPTVAILLGIRDGRKDARAGALPFLWGLIFHKGLRPQLLKGMFTSVRNLVSIAILLDLISQYLIFRMVRPGAALILGPVLIAARTVAPAHCRTGSLVLARELRHLLPINGAITRYPLGCSRL